MSTSHQSYCRICGAQCGMVVTTEDNRITKITSDKEHPVTQGYLCYKGVTAQDVHNGEGRLLKARKKLDDGSQVDIDTTSALDEMHEKLAALIDQYGPECVAVYYGTGSNTNAMTHAMLQPWQSCIGTPWLFSSMTVDQSAKWVGMSRMGIFPTGRHNYKDLDAYLVAGGNALVSHGSMPYGPFPNANMLKAIKEAKARGMKMIVVDPRKTEMARFADLHLQILPGEDMPVFAAMLNVIFDNGWEDKAFCERFVDSVEALKQAVKPFTPELAAQRAGVPAEQIEEAARIYATAKCRSATSGTGTNMAANSNLAEHLLESLNVVTGAYRRAGDIIRNPGTFFAGFPDQEMVVPPNRTWEQEPKLPASGAGKLFGEYPTSRLPGEILSDNEQTRIRALFVVGGNPVAAMGDPAKVQQAFEHLDLLVTLDPCVTKTVELSHYAIPVTMDYEHYDFTGMLEMLFLEPFAQIAKPLVERPEGTLCDWEFFWESAKRMGKTLKAHRPSFGGEPDPSAPSLELNMEKRPDATDIIQWFCSLNDLSFDDITSYPQGVKIKKDPITIREADPENTARMDVCPPDVADEIAQAASEYLDSENLGSESGANTTNEFPFRLSCRRLLEVMNSAYCENSRTRKRYPTNPVFINLEDMVAEKLEEGMRVRISSDAGSVTGRVKADKTMRSGVISISHMWGSRDSDDPDNSLTAELIAIDRNLEPINFMPLFSGIPVAIEKIEGERIEG